MKFEKFAAVQSVESGNTIYADVINHCGDYKNFIEPGDFPTSAHECSHGIHAFLRNRVHGLAQETGRPLLTFQEPPSAPAGVKLFRMPQPVVEEDDEPIMGNGVNAFYYLKDRYSVFQEPPFKKRDIAKFIPSSLRKTRYNLYIEGQTAWDNQPLYVWDEWNAYINGGMTAVELAKLGKMKPGGTDWVYGPLEFCTYGMAVCLAALEKNCLSPELAEGCKWFLLRAFNVYLDGRGLWPFDGQDQIYEMLKSGSDGQPFRALMQDKLHVNVPDKVQPEDDDPKPAPDQIPWIFL